jgi:hypothetical protein
MPQNPTTENQPNPQTQLPNQDTSQYKLLPEFMYCPDCGETLYSCSLSFAATNAGRVYGSAWLSSSGIETETNDEENSYDEYTYSCDDDDTDVTSQLEKAEVYIDLLRRRIGNISLDSNIQKIQRMVDAVRHPAVSFNWISRDYMFIGYKKYNAEDGRYQVHTMLNPQIVEIAKNMAADENYMFDFNNTLYLEMITAYNNLLTQAIATENVPDSPERANQIRDYMGNFRPGAYEFGFGFQAHEQNLPEERDPINSPIINANNHIRWKDNDLSNICSCEHCSYAFECDSEIDVIICPKCKKETKNAN